MKEINQSNLPVHLGELQGEVTHEAQEKIFFDYLLTHVVSATMVNRATGVEQKCITRYKRKFEKVGLLAEVKTARCKVTGRNVAYITTNKDLFPKTSPQLTLFDK
jgi:hypothetical protein